MRIGQNWILLAGVVPPLSIQLAPIAGGWPNAGKSQPVIPSTLSFNFCYYFTIDGRDSFSTLRKFTMIRSMRLAVGFVAILSLTGPDAKAQWGYGGWGWGGWGGGASTLQGSELQGAAQFAMGAGMYNLDTAQARSINADTAMRYNDYVA